MYTTSSVLLVIEDDPTVRELLNSVMRPHFVIYEAETLATALSITNDVKPTAVILDLILPNCRGLESLRKYMEASPDAVVIVLTGDTTVQGPEAIAAGAFAFVAKPFTPKDILERVNDAIGMSDRIEKLKRHYDSTRELGENIKKTINEMRPA